MADGSKTTLPPLSQRIRRCSEQAQLLPPEMAGPGVSGMDDWADEVEELESRIEFLERGGYPE